MKATKSPRVFKCQACGRIGCGRKCWIHEQKKVCWVPTAHIDGIGGPPCAGSGMEAIITDPAALPPGELISLGADEAVLREIYPNCPEFVDALLRAQKLKNLGESLYQELKAIVDRYQRETEDKE